MQCCSAPAPRPSAFWPPSPSGPSASLQVHRNDDPTAAPNRNAHKPHTLRTWILLKLIQTNTIVLQQYQGAHTCMYWGYSCISVSSYWSSPCKAVWLSKQVMCSSGSDKAVLRAVIVWADARFGLTFVTPPFTFFPTSSGSFALNLQSCSSLLLFTIQQLLFCLWFRNWFTKLNRFPFICPPSPRLIVQ